VIDHTHGKPVEKTESDRDTDHYEIPAHCAILASRKTGLIVLVNNLDLYYTKYLLILVRP
jgi:hypothetical protein